MAAKWQKELMAIIAHKENVDILCDEWLNENDVELSGLSVQQKDENDESVTMPIITTFDFPVGSWYIYKK